LKRKEQDEVVNCINNFFQEALWDTILYVSCLWQKALLLDGIWLINTVKIQGLTEKLGLVSFYRFCKTFDNLQC
jgi:hypothetical protein